MPYHILYTSHFPHFKVGIIVRKIFPLTLNTGILCCRLSNFWDVPEIEGFLEFLSDLLLYSRNITMVPTLELELFTFYIVSL